MSSGFGSRKIYTLYQFAGSHYCEKVRWALDYKRAAFEVQNLIPGPHLRKTRRLAPRTTLPILVDKQQVVQGSPEIITYLDKQHRQPPLTPTSTQDAAMAHEWERYLDLNLGVPLRLLFYFHALGDRRLAIDFLVRDGPWYGRAFYFVAFPRIRAAMRQHMGINKEAAAAAERSLESTFDRLDEKLAGRKFLAGPYFSRADLTASALLFHRWQDGWPVPPYLDTFLQAHDERPFFRWARDIYGNYRASASP